MRTPTISIITVNFNNNEGLKKTLRSIEVQSYTSPLVNTSQQHNTSTFVYTHRYPPPSTTTYTVQL